MSLAVARLPFPVDEAKLAPPATRTGSVDKTDVIARLLGSTTPFATIVAPAGYGKSTLLSRWANLDPRPFAWVQVDDRDDDSIVFLRSIAAAVDRVHPIAAAQIEALVGPGESIWSRVPFIGNALATLTTPLVLAIDDIHAITNPECLNVLASLFAYVPPGSQVVVTSRAEPALPIARWRAQGMVEEVDASDLRLDDLEAATLLRGADVILAEDVLQQTYYLGKGQVDYWLMSRNHARRYVERVNGQIRDFYTGAGVISDARMLEELLQRERGHRIFVIGSGENQSDRRQGMRGDMDAVLRSSQFEVIYEGRDGLTQVWRATEASPQPAAPPAPTLSQQE